MHELLTTEQMIAAEQWAIKTGVPDYDLMEHAGRGAAELIMACHEPQTTAILCGPGNNGGDGYVIARLLQKAGWPVNIYMLAHSKKGSSAERAQGLWRNPVKKITSFNPDQYSLIIDAVFGTGLERPVERALAGTFKTINESDVHIIAIDLPSGIEGTTGAKLGAAIKADQTITFFRAKTGHALMPGLDHCGKTVCVDIGIEDGALADLSDAIALHNDPDIWLDIVPLKTRAGHKYDYGHVGVIAGDVTHIGASRLSGKAAFRIGAGAVTLAVPPDAIPAHAGHAHECMLKSVETEKDLEPLLEDARINTMVVGPGNGICDRTRTLLKAALTSDKQLVLDADAITVCAEDPEGSFDLIKKRENATILTPHGGEFSRLFPNIGKGDLYKLEQARAAAKLSGAIIVYKGADTIIAAPDGNSIINTTGYPWLATAGSGDVLAGMIGGLLAQGKDPIKAAACAVWMHALSARLFGPGLMATDIIANIPYVLQDLLEYAE